MVDAAITLYFKVPFLSSFARRAGLIALRQTFVSLYGHRLKCGNARPPPRSHGRQPRNGATDSA